MKPTILHVLEAFAGGTERHVLDLVRHVSTFDHVVAVPSRHQGVDTGAAAERVALAGGRVEIVEMTRAASGQHRNVGALARLRRLVGTARPVIVHGHSSVGGAFARVAAIGTGIPTVYTPNGVSPHRPALVAERVLGRRTGAWIAVSASEAAIARRHRLCRPERLHLIPNGIDVEPPPALDPPLRVQLGIAASTPLVGCIGRLAWQKAPEVYVAACARIARDVPEAEFVLIGAGPQRNLVDDALRAAGLGTRFHLVDSLAGAAAALGELDVYVLPSRFEGGPYTPLEAMRAGTAVVVTDVAGNRDTVEDGVSGRVVPPGDPTAVAAAVIELLTSPDLRARLAAAGQARLVERFDVCLMAAATERVYAALLGGGAAAGGGAGTRLGGGELTVGVSSGGVRRSGWRATTGGGWGGKRARGVSGETDGSTRSA